MTETYFLVEYRLGNSWQPTLKRYKSYIEAKKEFRELLEKERSSLEKSTTSFRIVEISTMQLSMEEIKCEEV